jgi:hypothetical protein
MQTAPKSKIPHALAIQILSFFWEQHRERPQAVLTVLLYYNSVRDEWKAVVPTQYAGEGVCDYNMPREVPSGYELAGAWTSHGIYPQYFSQTDLRDSASYGPFTRHFMVGAFPDLPHQYDFEGPINIGIVSHAYDAKGEWDKSKCLGDLVEGMPWSWIREEGFPFYPPIRTKDEVSYKPRPIPWSKKARD